MPRMSTFERVFCQSPPWRAFTRRLVLPWALQGVRPSGHVLEIGSGSGTMAAQILEAFPDIHLTATDIDPAMVRDGEVRLARFGERASAREASATELPFDDESFDVVLSFIMLHHVVDWQRALGEALRVLRPGGILVGYDLLSTSPLRLLHRVEGQPFRMTTLDALRRDIAMLPVAQSTIRPSFVGFTVRFVVTKQRLVREPQHDGTKGETAPDQFDPGPSPQAR